MKKGDTMKSTPSVILQIKSNYNTFNETEKKIAEYIIDNPRTLINSTISQVAEALDLADATIFRFCKKINFKGFQDLKITLATEVTDGIKSYANEELDENDDQQSIINKVFKANMTAINDTLYSIDPKNMEKAANTILEADQIVFYGNGGSGAVAMDAHHKFLRTGLKVSSYTDYHMQLMSVAQLTPKDVIIVISHTGSNLNIMNIVDIAKENGTKSIGITSFSKSPINEKVDISLNAVSQETAYQFEAFASRIAHLSIIDALYISVKMKRKDETDQAVKRMRDAIAITRI
ncbi:MurR/RpiR family transcriptional regulator [Anaerosalibacter sp. Marseille-P3206]|uniref:MurR/RpiR family transcriptional regulator n=1 Tax=Anaerosalibacter sp. Marseille-P3206 TaxID=1871005 RepID=UPI00190E9054|nr:MurR/RpiR family transcriptional regulator [Anaerosalibacter sp. Marseille-P3206]